jgi:hypothetical protein
MKVSGSCVDGERLEEKDGFKLVNNCDSLNERRKKMQSNEEFRSEEINGGWLELFES